MKNKNIFTVIVFCAILAVFSLAHVVLPDKGFSENENRYLKLFPEFSFSALYKGQYTKDFETYINDQFPMRDEWINLKTLSEMAFLKRDTNGVYFGKDNYIIEKFTLLDKERLTNNVKYVNEFAKLLKEKNIPTNVMLIPTSSSILRNKLPIVTDEVDQDKLIESLLSENYNLIDVTKTLTAHNNEEIYYHTDHHYTSLGAFYCYNEFRKSNNLAEKDINDFQKKLLSDKFYGTLYSKIGLSSVKPDEMWAYYTDDKYTIDYNLGAYTTDSIYEEKYLSEKDKYSTFLNANQSLSVIKTENKNGKKIFIVKDSYANTFAQFLIGDYEEIHVVDLRYFKMPIQNYIDESGITEALILYNTKGFSEDKNLYSLLY